MRATPPSRADVRRDAFERHDRDRAGLLGDDGLLGRDDVHDDAALEHLGETALDGVGPGCFSESIAAHCPRNRALAQWKPWVTVLECAAGKA